MKKTLLFCALTAMMGLASCSSDENVTVHPPVTPQEAIQALFSDYNASMSITTVPHTSAQAQAKAARRMKTVTDGKGTRYEYSRDELLAMGPEETALATFYVRIDGKIPTDAEYEAGHLFAAANTSNYYPQTSTGGTLYALSGEVYPKRMGEKLYIVDRYGVAPKDLVKRGPTLADMKPYLVGTVKYHGDIVYQEGHPELDKLVDDNYTIIWYVAKYETDKSIHVDGAIVPKEVAATLMTNYEAQDAKKGLVDDKTEESAAKATEAFVSFATGVDHDVVLDVDDFDLRKSGVDGYVYYHKNVDANSLTYNRVTISRGEDMRINIDGLNNLDWSPDANGNPAIWTFETWLWGKDLGEADFASWMTKDAEGHVTNTDNGTIDNALYNIEFNRFKGFQSEGTVPYVKISMHVTKKKEDDSE